MKTRKFFFFQKAKRTKKQSEANKANFFFEIEKSKAKRSVNKARRSKSRKANRKVLSRKIFGPSVASRKYDKFKQK